jgi:hypothetical protein
MSTDPLNPATWRLQTAGGIPYRIITMNGESEQDRSSATEVYLVAASQVLNFILESFPPPAVLNGISFYRNRRMPGLPNMTTRRIRWEPFIDGKPIDPFGTDTAAADNTYPDLARVSIEYSNERDKDENDPESFVDITGSVAGEILHVALPKGKLVSEQVASESDSTGGSTGSQNTRSVLSAVQLVPEVEWTIRWDQVQRKFFKETLLPRIREAIGKVNSVAWPLLFQDETLPRYKVDNEGNTIQEFLKFEETLLFVGFAFEEVFHVEALIPNVPERETERDKAQREEQQREEEDIELQPVKIELKFLEKRVEEYDRDNQGGIITPIVGNELKRSVNVYGHNHIWNDDNGGWERVYVDGGSRSLYDQYDFNNLFLTTQATPTDEN